MKNIFLAILLIILSLPGWTKLLAEEGNTTSTSIIKSNTTGTGTNANDTTSTTTTTTTTIVHDVDADIVSAINAKYANDAALIGTDIQVSSKKGVVTLNGSVTMQSQADEAVDVAKSIPAVKTVLSNINVKTNPKQVKPIPPLYPQSYSY